MHDRIPGALIPCLLLVSACAIHTDGDPAIYRDASQPIAQRVDDLIRRMTLEEKVAQLHCIWPQASEEDQLGEGILDAKGNFDSNAAAKHIGHGIGQIARPNEAKDIATGIAFQNDIQRYLLEQTRLGIPAMFHEEGLHGHMAPGATCYPQAIALACTFDPELVERIFTATAKEMRARGVHQALTPVLDVCRDPRWGRTEETYGEDPYLAARLGVACIRGFQGRGADFDSILGVERVIATAKHFAVHGQPEGGINCAPANFSERQIRSVFLPPFAAAIREAGVLSVMPSYNEVDGVPVHANRWLLADVLRSEFGFAGFVVSDYYGIEQLHTLHHVTGTTDAAGRTALKVGVDIELPDPGGYANLANQVRTGDIPVAQIDRAVRRILRAKLVAGCFDRPYAVADKAMQVVNCAEHRALALEAARKAIVLLENRNHTLPLRTGPREGGTLRKLAVLGPNADRVLLGGYTNPDGPGRTVTILQGIRNWVRQHAADRIEVGHAEGCRITVPDADYYTDEVELSDPKEDGERIAAAVAAAKSADVSILVLGGNEATCREGWSKKHLGDRDSLTLLGRQQELFERVAALGKPTIVILLGGRPFAIGDIAVEASAILHGFYLGQEGGTAVAEVLFGGTNPSGKLPITFPRSVGQIPAHYGQKPSARRGYLFADASPLYPFGHGLSYTEFAHHEPILGCDKIAQGESTEVVARLENVGDRTGTEVVQLYIRDLVSTVTRPVLELRGFQRVRLKPGEAREVRFQLTPDLLAGIGMDNRRSLEAGEFDVFVGPSSADLKSVRLTVTEN